MRSTAFAAAVVVLLVSCGGKGPIALEPGALEAGAAIRVLPLPVGHSTAGYLQSRALGGEHPSDDPGSAFADVFPATRGVQSAPTVRVVVLDNGHRQLVIARLDMIFIPWEATDRVLVRAREELGLDLEGKLILAATHTHAAGCRLAQQSPEAPLVASRPEPERHAWAHGLDTYSEESMRRVTGAVVDAIAEALDGLQPARFGYGFGENLTAARDRRCENDFLYGESDHEGRVTVLRIDDAAGAPIAVLFHYPMHGTIYDSDSRNLSVDAPGHVEYAVEETFDRPVVAVYLQGAAGDVSPAGDIRGHRDSQAMARVGWDLARSVREIWEGVDTESEVVLDSLDRRVPLTFEDLGYQDGEFHYDGATLCNNTHGFCGQTETLPKEEVFCIAPSFEEKGKYSTWLAAARIGELHLLTLPGEPVTEVGRRVLAAAAEEGAVDAIAVGYAMDHDGYILTEDDWLAGGYETTITFWGWRHGDYLIEQARDVLHELRFGEALDARPVDVPQFRETGYTPYLPSESSPAPALIDDLPAAVPRLTEVRMAFFGGDPALGHPEVTLEREVGGAFEVVRTRGWRPVSSLTAGELPLIYESAPTWLESPEASARAHRWEVVWAPGPGLEVGSYRLRVDGFHRAGAAAEPYALSSTTVQVTESTALELDAAVVDGTTLAVTLRYPASSPRRSPLEGSGGWQVGGFPMLSPHYAPPFVPVLEAAARSAARVTPAGGSAADVALTFDGGGDREARTYAPGEGPGFRGGLPPAAGWEAIIPAGALTDGFGNTHAEIRVSLAP